MVMPGRGGVLSSTLPADTCRSESHRQLDPAETDILETVAIINDSSDIMPRIAKKRVCVLGCEIGSMATNTWLITIVKSCEGPRTDRSFRDGEWREKKERFVDFGFLLWDCGGAGESGMFTAMPCTGRCF